MNSITHVNSLDQMESILHQYQPWGGTLVDGIQGSSESQELPTTTPEMDHSDNEQRTNITHIKAIVHKKNEGLGPIKTQ